MKKAFLLAFSNIKKSKGQVISFLVMITIAMAMLVTGAITYTDCDNNFERNYEKLDSEDGMVTVQKAGCSQQIEDDIKNSDKVKDYEIHNVLMQNATFDYGSGTMTIRMIFENKDQNINIGKSEIIEESDEKYEDPIYLPLLFKLGGKYKLGDDFILKINSKEYNFKVKGFFENLFLGSTSMPVCGALFDDDEFNKFDRATNEMFESNMYVFRMNDKKDNREFTSDIYSKYTPGNENEFLTTREFYSGCKSSRTFMSKITATMIAAFSFIIVIISLVVIRFRITNSIEDDVKSIGALKAMGYTSKNLIFSYVMQFGIINLVGLILGYGLARIILPFIGSTLEAQSGMIWEINVDAVLVLVIILIMMAVVTLTVLITSRKIKKLPPMIALRNGFQNNNFKKNHFEFATSKGNKNLIFGLKSAFMNKKQNIMIIGIFAVVTFITLFVYSLYYNMAIDEKAFVDVIAGEVTDVEIKLNGQNIDEDLINKIRQDDRVEKAIYWQKKTIFCDKDGYYTYVTDDFSEGNTDMCYEGRNPEHDNEVAIGGLSAKNMDKSIGDEIELNFGDKTEKYIITGFIQTGNNSGYDAELTTEGIKRIIPDFKQVSINTYLKDGADADEFIDSVNTTYPDSIERAYSVKEILDAQMKSYIDISVLLVIIIGIMTCLIITMILYLVIKSMITKNKVNLGIQKAIGYTSGQLRLQMAFTFVPIALVGTGIGLVMGIFLTNTFFSKMLSMLGIMKMILTIIVPIFIVIAIAIVLYSFLIAFLISSKIKKITPYSLIKE